MTKLTNANKLVGKQQVHQALNAFISHRDDAGLPGDSEKHSAEISRPLAGTRIALKDNICTVDFPTTCGSLLLNGFSSPYEATVARKLRLAGALIVGKTNMDEFGMGSHSTNSFHGPVMNKYSRDSETLSAGGSSGGSAVAVASRQGDLALGTDTGGSIRLPAAHTGLVGFKPSYGMVSRWGVVAYANSLDTVGILANSVRSVERVFGVIKGFDPNDPTSLNASTISRIQQRLKSHRSNPAIRRTVSRDLVHHSMKIGVPKEYNTLELQPIVREAWVRTLQRLRERGHSIHSLSLPTTRMALSAYYILAPAEASSNLAKYDGARYGNKVTREEGTSEVLYAATRGRQFGKEVKRRILLGSYSLSAAAINNHFIRAQRVRRLVQQDFNNVFAFPHPLLDHVPNHGLQDEKVDFILTPTTQSLPPKLKDIQSQAPTDIYSDDVLTVPASLAGLPAASVPVPLLPNKPIGENDISSVGIQVIGQYGDDENLLSMARIVETLD